MTDAKMTIREMCELFDVTPRTLRFYETKALISPQRIGQKRLYARRERARLKLILRGKRFGFSLDEIRGLLDLYYQNGGGMQQVEKAYEMAKERLSDLKGQRDMLNAAIEDLEEQMRWAKKATAQYNDRQARDDKRERAC